MHGRSLYVALALSTLLLLPALAAAGAGIAIADVSEPRFGHSPLREGEFVDVSFQVELWNKPAHYGCREAVATGMSGFPLCVYVLQWTLSWDGEWLSRDARPFATGFVPHVWSLHEPNSVVHVDVEERVRVNAPPGEHDVHLRVNWIAGVPISTIGGVKPFNRAYPCGLDDHVDPPFLGCTYDGHDWRAAPVVSVDVQARSLGV